MKYLLFFSIAILFTSVLLNWSHCYPWLLLFNGDRDMTVNAWKKYAPINNAIWYPNKPIAEVYAEGKCIYEIIVLVKDAF